MQAPTSAPARSVPAETASMSFGTGSSDSERPNILRRILDSSGVAPALPFTSDFEELPIANIIDGTRSFPTVIIVLR